jgi:hypothetical protein
MTKCGLAIRLRKLKTDEKSSVFTILACLANLNDANLFSLKYV